MCELCYSVCPECHPELFNHQECPHCHGEGRIYTLVDNDEDEGREVSREEWDKADNILFGYSSYCEACEGRGYL